MNHVFLKKKKNQIFYQLFIFNKTGVSYYKYKQIHFLIKVTDVAPRESSQLLIFNQPHLPFWPSPSLHRTLCQHIPLHHTLVKPEAPIPNSESRI